MFEERKQLYRNLEQKRDSKVLVYVTGDRPGHETQISAEAFDLFVNQLDLIGDVPKITLFIYTRGGDTLAAWSLINLIRMFCKELEVIIPSKCHSSGTLMSLGANKIVMTKQATLGPIDPSLNGPLNPQVMINNQPQSYSVSVEDVKGYISVAKKEFGITDGSGLAQILLALSEKVHPLVLGNVYRAQSQIQMLARKLLTNQIDDPKSAEKVISFLCSESGSHDYTINRSEAMNDLGLKIEIPDEELYALIKQIYSDIKDELKLSEPFDPSKILGTNDQAAYESVRCLIESPETFSYQYRTNGLLHKQQIAPNIPQFVANNIIINEGWKRYD